ncbi:MAG TPA: protein translocase subunit SecD [Streptosporangiaceae bacterium]
MAPPSVKTSRPGRLLAVLAVLILVMLISILRGDIIHPGSWHSNFKVGLGLDLSSGTTVTLKAVPDKGHSTPSSGAMNQAISIMNNRVNGAGFNNALVQQQGSQNITVSVPGQGAQKVVGIVGKTAQLRFRQVLLCSGVGTTCAPQALSNASTTSPSGSASPSPSTSTSPSSSASPSASASAKASASSSASGGTGQAAGATRLGAAGAASPSPSASSSSKPASSSPSPSASGSSSAPAASGPSTAGDPSKVSKSVLALFNKVNCADKNWQQKAYGNNSAAWDDTAAQIVSCDPTGVKYVLATAPVTGQELTTASAVLDNQTNQWIVQFSLNGKGGRAFANLTTQMYTTYSSSGTPTSVLDQFAIVLDGAVVSAPDIQQPITGGSGQISGPNTNPFTQTQATKLANVLKYGALPLTFHTQDVSSVSPELGSAQLHAGLVAALIGLLLVVIYSFLYYRGLGLVSVFSLAIAALLSYLAVVLLSRYQGFTLTLDGVAGLIVAIGITADSFVVYFERLRDEVREGRSLRAAVERGWTRARRTILVSDTVSFLAAALLYIIALGDVKGFAFTLGMTTLIDVVVVFLFTKPMVTLLARTKFYGQGHKLSGLDPARLGARSPWRGSRRPRPTRPATGGAASTATATPARTTPKEA